MDFNIDFDEVFHFLFETYAGVGILILAALVLSILVCAIWERATRKKYVDRGPGDDEWAVFDVDEDEEDNSKEDSEDDAEEDEKVNG